MRIENKVVRGFTDHSILRNKGKDIPAHAMKEYGEIQEYLRESSISVLDGGDCQIKAPAALTMATLTPCLFSTRVYEQKVRSV